MKNLSSLLLLVCALTSSIDVEGQEQLKHQKKHFVSEDGKLYWQADQPVYLFASNDPNGKDPQRLESETTPDFANPLYLDTEGRNYVRTRWAVNKVTKESIPETEVMFEIYRDGQAPVAEVSFVGAEKYVNAGITYYGKELMIEANAQDRHAGVASIYFSANTKPYEPFAATETVMKDGEYIYKFYAVDNVGNAAHASEFIFTVDVTTPETKHLVEGDHLDDILSPRSIIKLNATDESSGVRKTYYTIDDVNEKQYYGKVVVDDLDEGEHTIKYYSVDNVGNKEVEREFKFYLDQTTPEVIASVQGDQFDNGTNIYVSSRTSLKLASTDNKAGLMEVNFKIDNQAVETYSSPFSIPETTGKHHIAYYGTDKVNNNYKSLSTKVGFTQKVFLMDNEAPVLSHEFSGMKYHTRDTMFITSATEIILGATDAESGMNSLTYQVNGGQSEDYTKPLQFDMEGYYLVQFTGTDKVNNKRTDKFCFIVDNQGPVVENILSMQPIGSIALNEKDGDLNVHSKGVKLYLGATDEVIDTDVVYYSLNDQKERIYTSPIAINSTGIVSFTVRAVDKLGNETKADKVEIFVK